MSRKRALFRKYIFRAITFAVLLVLFFAGSHVFKHLKQNTNKPVRFTFSLPLEKKFQTRLNLDPQPPITDVFVAGYFSDWQASNQSFQMEETSPGFWKKELPLPPGDNAYKFVVFLSNREQPVWIEDPNAQKYIPDSFGGRNSVIRISDVGSARVVFNIIILGLLVVLVLHTLLEPVIRAIMNLHISFRFKISICAVLVTMIANCVFIGYNFYRVRSIPREGFIDQINLIHGFLKSQGVDFSRLQSPPEKFRLQKAVTSFFRDYHARNEKNKPSNMQVMISSLSVFSTNRELLDTFIRKEAEIPVRQIAESSGFSNINNYFSRVFLKELETVGSDNILSIRPHTFLTADSLMTNYDNNYKDAAVFLGYNNIVVPIFHNYRLAGFYGANLLPQLYGNEFKNILLFNIYLIPIVLLLVFLTLNNIGRILIYHLEHLIAWTRQVANGNFEEQPLPRSGDEFDDLTANFNQMRISLGRNLHNLQQLNLLSFHMQRVKSKEELYELFLAFLTATCGFDLDRAIIFCARGSRIKGCYGSGYLQESAIRDAYGSLRQFRKHTDNHDVFFSRQKTMIKTLRDETFIKTVASIVIDSSAESIFRKVQHSNEAGVFQADSPECTSTDRIICDSLNLNKFVLIPFSQSVKKTGILLVDTRFSKRNITAEEINQFLVILNDFSTTLANFNLVENLEDTVKRRTRELARERNMLHNRNSLIEKDLEMARDIQMQMLPVDLHNNWISTKYMPMDKVGGDYFDIIELDDDSVGVFLSDVSGHGVPAAFITTMLKSSLRQLSGHYRNPAAMMYHLNRQLANNTHDHFITALYGVFSRKTKQFVYANAGHNLPVLIHENRVEEASPENRSLPLSIMPDTTYTNSEVTLPERGKLLLYTDGLTDVIPENHEDREISSTDNPEAYGETAFNATLQQHGRKKPAKLLDEILKSIREYRQSDNFEDDICLICIMAETQQK